MKVIIKKSFELSGKYFFEVYKEGIYVTCFEFKPNVPEEDIYNEDLNYSKALAIAKKIESGHTSFTEIVYETPS